MLKRRSGYSVRHFVSHVLMRKTLVLKKHLVFYKDQLAHGCTERHLPCSDSLYQITRILPCKRTKDKINSNFFWKFSVKRVEVLCKYADLVNKLLTSQVLKQQMRQLSVTVGAKG